jgi:transposase, IS5 family
MGAGPSSVAASGRLRRARAIKRQVEIAVAVLGYNNHIGIDGQHDFLWRYRVTHAAAHDANDGGQLGAVLDRDNTASAVWADTAYRAAANWPCSGAAA